MQEILCAKEVLLDDNRRRKYDEQHFSPIRIYVKTGTSRTTSFLVPLSATISEVKDKVSLAWPWVLREEMVLGLPGWHVGGNKMEDTRSLSYYRVGEDQVLHMVVQSVMEQELMVDIKEERCKSKRLEQMVIEGQNREEVLRGKVEEERHNSERFKKQVLEVQDREEDLRKKLILANDTNKQWSESQSKKRKEEEEKCMRMEKELEALKFKLLQAERDKDKLVQQLVENRDKLVIRNKPYEQEIEVPETEVGRDRKSMDDGKQKVEDPDRDMNEVVGRKSSRIKRKAVEQPHEQEKRSAEIFKTVLSKRLLELYENSTRGEKTCVLRNEVKKSIVKRDSTERGNLAKCMKKVDHQETKTFGTILCSEVGCQKKFQSRHGFLKHKRLIHLGVKLHKCEKGKCHSCFCRREELEDHMRKEHGYPKLACGEAECKEKFFSAGGLQKHKKKH